MPRQRYAPTEERIMLNPRPTKGAPTRTNLYALGKVFGDQLEVSNQLDAVDVPHIKRCVAAGLVEVVGGRDGVLRLTEAGQAALAGTTSNPRKAPKQGKVVLPLGEYEDLRVRVALVRHPDYGKEPLPVIGSSTDAAAIMKTIITPPAESFYVLLLTAQNEVTGIHEVALGGATRVAFEPMTIFQAAVVANSPAIICAHNHPSGNPRLSAEDITTAQTLKRAGDLLGIRVLDFLVIAVKGYVSMADQGRI